MHLSPRILLEAVTAAGVLGCCLFYALCLVGIASFRKARRIQISSPLLPPLPVSVLKPLKGVDPGMWESFCSHAEQNYPQFELVFGVSDAADPACDVVRKLQAKYNRCPIKLMVCDNVLGANVKVSTLAQMMREASYELVVVNDSDVRVGPDYLRQVVALLSNPQVGLVTCLYRGCTAGTLGSRLEALSISTDFIPGVLAARFLERGIHFGLGSTLAFRREDLAAIGGFESFLDVLADDYELGRRIASTGRRVEISATTVTTFLPSYTLSEFWWHQLRWSRTIRDARRWGYAGLLFTFGLPWAVAMLVAAGGAEWAWLIFAVTVGARLAVGISTAGVLDERLALEDILLLPLRDLIAPFIWAAGWVGNQVQWRGETFYLKNGRLSKGNARDEE